MLSQYPYGFLATAQKSLNLQGYHGQINCRRDANQCKEGDAKERRSGSFGTADFVSELHAAPLVAVFSKTPSHFFEVKSLLL